MTGNRVALRSWDNQTLYGDHRVAHLVHDMHLVHGTHLVHVVHRVHRMHRVRNVPDDRRAIVRMRCGVITVVSVAVAHITSEPLTCLWCVAGIERFRTRF